jgi:hypothetical protein
MKKNRKGSALLLVIMILAVFVFLGAINARIVYNCYASASALLCREQAFHLAEAGLEKGKVELTHNPSWYTDLPYYIEDSTEWLRSYAVGEETNLGEGVFKLVREKGKNRLYSIGSKGKGIVILKLIFSTPPFKSLEWEEI